MSRLITYVFKITDEAAWRESGNPFNAECASAQLPGLVCVGVSAGDLMAVCDDFEAHDDEAYDASSRKHIMSHLPEVKP